MKEGIGVLTRPEAVQALGSASEHNPLEPYSGVLQLAAEISYFTHPDFLKGAMSTALQAVASFHVQEVGLSVEAATENMADTQQRLVTQIAAGLDNPRTRNAARHQAIWFVRSTGDFFESYFHNTPFTPRACPTSLPLESLS